MKKTPGSSYRGSWPQSHCSEDYDMSIRRNDKPLVFVASTTAFQTVLLQIVVVLFFRAHPYGTELHHQHDNNQHERVHFLALFWFAGLDRNGGHPWRNQRSIMHVRHAVFHTSASRRQSLYFIPWQMPLVCIMIKCISYEPPTSAVLDVLTGSDPVFSPTCFVLLWYNLWKRVLLSTSIN